MDHFQYAGHLFFTPFSICRSPVFYCFVTLHHMLFTKLDIKNLKHAHDWSKTSWVLIGIVKYLRRDRDRIEVHTHRQELGFSRLDVILGVVPTPLSPLLCVAHCLHNHLSGSTGMQSHQRRRMCTHVGYFVDVVLHVLLWNNSSGTCRRYTTDLSHATLWCTSDRGMGEYCLLPDWSILLCLHFGVCRRGYQGHDRTNPGECFSQHT